MGGGGIGEIVSTKSVCSNPKLFRASCTNYEYVDAKRTFFFSIFKKLYVRGIKYNTYFGAFVFYTDFL